MPVINLLYPPFIVDAGPFPGVYASAEQYALLVEMAGLIRSVNDMDPKDTLEEDVAIAVEEAEAALDEDEAEAPDADPNAANPVPGGVSKEPPPVPQPTPPSVGDGTSGDA